MISADFLVITEINGKKLVSYSDYIDLQSEYVRETEKQKADIKELRKQVEELDKQNTDIQECHMKLYNESKDEMRRMKEENEELKAEIQRLKESQGESNGCFGNCSCEDDLAFMNESDEIGNLLSELQDQHQHDCIRINDLTTTINVLSGLYANLRKNAGMD